MPVRKDINNILVLGSGPIVIGQGNEYDYYGMQACLTLKALGYRTIALNSNPASMMTHPGLADKTYIESMTVGAITRIIEKERPDAIFPSAGGLTAFSRCLELFQTGILSRNKIKIIGVGIDAIRNSNERGAFKKFMTETGIGVTGGKEVKSVEEAESAASATGYPVAVRTSFLPGGRGNGTAYNVEELRKIAGRGIAVSSSGSVYVEDASENLEKFEVQVLRDANGRVIKVEIGEFMEAAGVHEGDSICVVPAATASDSFKKDIESVSCKIADKLNIVGAVSVLFFHRPGSSEFVIDSISPALSRSAAFFARATGLPLAAVAAKLACGIGLNEIVWGKRPLNEYVPSGSHAVVRMPCWEFSRIRDARDKLDIQMRSTGEVIAAGKTFQEALQKAIRSTRFESANQIRQKSTSEVMKMLNFPASYRLHCIFEALRRKETTDDIASRTHINKWFIEQINELVKLEEVITKYKGKKLPDKILKQAKIDGFSDGFLAEISSVSEGDIRSRRYRSGIVPRQERIGNGEKSCLFLTYQNGGTRKLDTAQTNKIFLLGGGPRRIGLSSEIDWGCTHAAISVKNNGYSVVFIECSPGSCALDTADSSYLAPLDLEEIYDIFQLEGPAGTISQFGGFPSLNLTARLEEAGFKVFGPSADLVNNVFDIKWFNLLAKKLSIPVLKSDVTRDLESLPALAEEVGFPLLLTSGRAVEEGRVGWLNDKDDLNNFINENRLSSERDVTLRHCPLNASSAEVHCIGNGKETFIHSITGQIEPAGVNAGDAACVVPPVNIGEGYIETMKEYSLRIARETGIPGMFTVIFNLYDNKVYASALLPMPSRNLPFAVAVTGAKPVVDMALKALIGKPFDMIGNTKTAAVGVKESVFPFDMFPEVDPVLGPEMKSTGQVMGIAGSFGLAYWKAEEAIGPLPAKGTVLITVASRDRNEASRIARKFINLGFKIKATSGTRVYLAGKGVPAVAILKEYEGRPNITDAIKNHEVQLIINIPQGKQSKHDDSYIRKAAINYKVPYITTLTGAAAAAAGIEAFQKINYEVKPLQEQY